MKKQRVAILGSTGSIGISTLDVIRRFPKEFEVVGLTAYNDSKRLEQQIREFRPRCIAVNGQGIDYLKKKRSLRDIKIYDVSSQLSEVVSRYDVDIVVLGIRGAAALLPFLTAVRCAKIVAPANKEALVMAGHIIMQEARKRGSSIIPVDSEQSAIFQCLNGRRREDLKKVYLTASGGPLRKVAKSRFNHLSVKDILKHPRWKMGKKITVDSATLMNKGLEVIEAKWLFGLDVKEIDVIIHPEAIIHSMVEFRDGSVLAQLGVTDMRLPIQYALTYPHRKQSHLAPVDFIKLKKLTFEKPNIKKFPALQLAYDVAKKGGSLPCVFNAANEEAVDAFLRGILNFSKICQVVEYIVCKHKIIRDPSLSDIWKTDAWAREEAKRKILN